MATFYAPKAVDRKKISRQIIEWMHENLDDSYHIFVEFDVPDGRQLDFLVLKPNGAYCIEAKEKPYGYAYVNGPWIYTDSRTGSIIHDNNQSGENPYKQATNEANSFRTWISKREIRDMVFKGRSDQIKLDNHKRIEFFKVQAAVLIPDQQQSLNKESDWCVLCNGIEQLSNLFEEKGWKSRFTVTEDEMQRIANALHLEKVSIIKLIDLSETGLPPAISGYEAYCGNLIDWMKTLDGNLDFYTPNTMTEVRQPKQTDAGNPDICSHSLLQTTADLLPTLKPGVRCLIEAEGGIGKTTLCLHLCREAAIRKLQDPTTPLPIYADLKDYLPDSSGFPSLLAGSLISSGLDARTDINLVLEKANLLIFLDGLNEIDEKAWPRFMAECRRWMPIMAQSAVLLTSRTTHRQQLSLPGLSAYRISPFSDQQLRDYIGKRHQQKLIQGVASDEINALLQVPLIASLTANIGHSFKIAKSLRNGAFYRLLCRELLQRELAKENRASEYQVLWDDLLELARWISQDWPASKGEASKTRTVEIIRERRFEPMVQPAASALEILLASQMLREHPQRGNISFFHDSIRSFFYAAWLFDAASEVELDKFLSEKTGDYGLFLNHPNMTTAYLFRKSALCEEVLQFLVSFATEGQNDARRSKILDRIFSNDPLLATSCAQHLSREEFLTRISRALGIANPNSTTAKSPYPFSEQCVAIFTHNPVDEGSWNRLENTNSANLIAEEIAVRCVIYGKISELAPSLLERLCRSMKRDSLPYSRMQSVPAWALDRFDDLIGLCPRSALVEIAGRIMHDGSPEEARNVAIILNYWTLRSFSKNMGLDIIQTLKNTYDETGEYVDYESVDSSWAFDGLISGIHLLQEWLNARPMVMPAHELEFWLRIFGLFESLFVLDPLVDTLKNLSPDSYDETLVVSNLKQIINLVHQDNSAARVMAKKMLIDWFNGAWNTSLSGPEFDESDVELICWGLVDVTRLNTDMSQQLVGLLDDPTQSQEAAGGIVRLYFEGLWTREQRSKKRLLERDRGCAYFSETHSDGTYEVQEWQYRSLGEFLSLLPCDPNEFRRSEERQLVQLESSIGGPADFMRAATILLNQWQERS